MAAKLPGVTPIEPEHPPADVPAEAQPLETPTPAAPPHPASGMNWRATGGGLAALGVAALKFKGLLVALLNFKWVLLLAKFGLGALSFLASVWFYAVLFGPKFGIAFVLLILLHEAGHAVVARGYGLRVPGIYFIPGLGAFTTMEGDLTAYRSATVALAGPTFGALGAGVCLAYGAVTNEPFWYAVASTAFFLNLFNMIPLGIFDGARITAAIAPRLWLAGLAIAAVLVVAFHWWSPILLIVAVLAIPRTIAAWRGELDARAATVTPSEKIKIAIAYFALLCLLAGGLALSQFDLPAHDSLRS